MSETTARRSNGYAWVVAVVGFMLGIGTITGTMAWGYISPFLAQSFNIEVTDIAIVMSVYSCLNMGLGFLVGILGENFGPRFVCGIGQFLGGLFLTLAGIFTGSLVVVCVFFVLSGVCVSCCGSTLPPKIYSAWFAPKWRSKAMTGNTLGGSLFGSALGLIIPALIVAGGWQGAFKWLGVIVMAAAVVWLVFGRNKPSDMGMIPFGEDPDTYVEEVAVELTEEQKAAAKAERRAGLAKVFKNKYTWIFGIFYIFWMTYGMGVNTFQITAIMAAGNDITMAGALASVNTLLIAASQFLWGALADKFSRKRILGLTVICGGLMYIFCYFVLNNGGVGAIVWAVFLIQGFFTGNVNVIQTLLAEVFTPDTRAIGPGVIVTLSLIGSFCGPVLGSVWIGGFAGNVISIFLFGALMCVISGLIALFLLPNTGGKYGDPMVEQYNKEHGIGVEAGVEAE